MKQITLQDIATIVREKFPSPIDVPITENTTLDDVTEDSLDIVELLMAIECISVVPIPDDPYAHRSTLLKSIVDYTNYQVTKV